jgi:hypothetical protein
MLLFIYTCSDRGLKMKRLPLLFLLFICLSSAVCAQELTPPLLRDAAHCLVANKFLGPSARDFAYLITTKDWPGEEVVYVVAYTGASRTKGWVFTIFLTKQGDHEVFDIQNNAKFVRTKKDPDGINFVEEALGGVWTHERLISAIKQIEKKPQFELSVRELTKASVNAACQSYTDGK